MQTETRRLTRFLIAESGAAIAAAVAAIFYALVLGTLVSWTVEVGVATVAVGAVISYFGAKLTQTLAQSWAVASANLAILLLLNFIVFVVSLAISVHYSGD